MTATLIAVQNVEVGGSIFGPNTVFSTDDASAAELLSQNLAATSAAQASSYAGLFPLQPSDDSVGGGNPQVN